MVLDSKVLSEVLALSRPMGKVLSMESEGELQYIYYMLSQIAKDKSVVHLGVYYGSAAAVTLLAMNDFNIVGSLYLCDLYMYHNVGEPRIKPFREREDIKWSPLFLDKTKKNIEKYRGKKDIHYLQGFTDDVNLSKIGKTAFIFIDADHTTQGCLLDLLKFSQILIYGGFILIHNYRGFETVERAVSIFLSIRKDYRIIGEKGSIVTLKKEKL